MEHLGHITTAVIQVNNQKIKFGAIQLTQIQDGINVGLKYLATMFKPIVK